MDFEYERFRRAIRWGDKEEAKEIAESIWKRSWDKSETADKLSEIMKEEGRFNTREFGSETTWDGITVRKGFFPELEIEKDEERYY